MHRKPESELVPLDTELEWTLKNLKKVRFAEALVMVEQGRYNNTFQMRKLIDLKGKELWKFFGNLLLDMIILQSSSLQLKQAIWSLSLH